MLRNRKTDAMELFHNEQGVLQYADTCENCRKECKQSFRVGVIRCRRREPVSERKERKAEKK